MSQFKHEFPKYFNYNDKITRDELEEMLISLHAKEMNLSLDELINNKAYLKNLYTSQLLDQVWNDYETNYLLIQQKNYLSSFEKNSLNPMELEKILCRLPSQFERDRGRIFLEPLISELDCSTLTSLDKSFCQKSINLPLYKDDSNSVINYGTALSVAISNSLDDLASAYIDLNADVNKFSPRFGNNPLLLAISKGWNHIDYEKVESRYEQQNIIKKLLPLVKEGKMDINAKHLFTGMTALHIACLRKDVELVTLLLDHGADLNAIDYQGLTPKDYLLQKNYEEHKETIKKLTGNYTYGDKNFDLKENQTTTATVLLEKDWENNKELLKNILENYSARNVENDLSTIKPPAWYGKEKPTKEKKVIEQKELKPTPKPEDTRFFQKPKPVPLTKEQLRKLKF